MMNGNRLNRAAAILLLSLLPVLLSVTPCLAQRYHTVTYTIEDGLAQSQPSAILEAESGHLWIGTYGGGVSRFDGRSFTNFTRADGLPAEDIYDLAEGPDGTIWIATAEGACSYDGRSFSPPVPGTEGETVISLDVDRNGRVWMGLYQKGLVIFDGSGSRTFTTEHGLPTDIVRHVYTDSGGTVWLGVDGGLCLMEGEGFSCISPEIEAEEWGTNSIHEDAGGRLLVATSQGLFSFDGEVFERKDLGEHSDSSITAVLADQTGTIWAGIRDGILHVMGEEVIHSTRENGLASGMVIALCEDREGNIWIGSDIGGLVRYRHSPFVLFDHRNGLIDESVWTFVEGPDGDIWVGTNSSGVLRYDGTTFKQYGTGDGLVDFRIYDSLLASNGDLWFLSPRGISRYDGDRFTEIDSDLIKDETWSIAEDREGNIWIGTASKGAFRYANGVFRHYDTDDGLPADNVAWIERSPDGMLWFVTMEGIAAWDGHAFRTISTEDGLPSDEVSALLVDRQGDLWISTFGSGIVRIANVAEDWTRSMQSFSVEDGLSHSHVVSIVEDRNGDLWFGTNRGLNRLDAGLLRAEGEARFTRYGNTEGFIGEEAAAGAAFADSRGNLWFGTIRGVVRYTPGPESRNLREPLVYIRGIRLFYEEHDWTAHADGLEERSNLPIGLVLPSDKNHLTFDFVGISLSDPLDVRYQFRLEGVDRAWTPATRETQATYANLPPGEYTFQVRAANGEGVWNYTPAELSFVITPPFWQSTWFSGSVTLAAILCIFGFIRIREKGLKRRQQQLEGMVDERTSELQLEKEKVERANRQLELLSLVARETDNVVFIADAEGRIEWVNEALTRQAGYTLETLKEIRGETLREIYDNRIMQEALQTAVTHKQSANFESKVQFLDGSDAWVSSTLTPIVDKEGFVQRLVIIDTIITERKAMEEELIRAKEAALAAARAKSDFLANMSHEIRTPMNGVIGMTNLLEDTDLQPEQAEFVEIIRSSGEALLAVINDILDISKIEAGKVELEERPFEIHSVIEEAIDLVTTKAAEKNLELAYIPSGDLPASVIGDAVRLRQVVINLLSNAVKFTSEGEIVVVVERRQSADGAEELHFAVRDTGIGIPRDRMDRLFQAFSQVDSSTTRQYGGTGLGLAISKRLCEQMAGTMWVESAQGSGSTFHFTIRTRTAEPAGGTMPQWQVDRLRNRRMLIVGRNRSVNQMVASHAGVWGMEVSIGSNLEDALLFLDRGERFDFAVMDGSLPEAACMAAARRLRAYAGSSDLNVLLLVPIDRRSGIEDEDGIQWITKPVKRQQLLDALLGAASPEPTADLPEVDPASIDHGLEQDHPLEILIADDNRINQKVVLRLLARMGYRADSAFNGFEVLEALDRKRYDLVLMDVQMPGMDGLEASRRIHASSGNGDRPRIVAITAAVLEDDRRRCIEAGMDDFIHKPVEVEELVEALRRCSRRAEDRPPHRSSQGE